MKSRYADRLAYQYIRNDELIQVNFGRYAGDIELFAAYLHSEFPDIRGKHIGILAGNSYRYTVCLWGIILAGGAAVPVNVRETSELIGNELAHADVTCLLTDDVSSRNTLCFHGEIRSIWEGVDENQRKQFVSCNYDSNEDRMALLLYTSGTTGSNKGVMISQRNLFAALRVYIVQIQEICNLLHQKEIKTVLTLPMFHMYGISTILACNYLGMTLNLCNELKYIDRDMKRMECEFAPVVSATLNKWNKDIACGRQKRLGTLKVINTAGTPANSALFKSFLDIGIRVAQFYGLTEVSGVTTYNVHDNEKRETVGLSCADVEIKLKDGEICIRSEGVTQGYYKDPEATQAAIRDGWLHTGDLGSLDEDGFLYITGRKKNLIILPAGENVSPEELEQILMQNDKIKEVVIFEENCKICAEIYCEEADQNEIKSYVSGKNRMLASYKRINRIAFQDCPLPKTSTGKMKRKGRYEDE